MVTARRRARKNLRTNDARVESDHLRTPVSDPLTPAPKKNRRDSLDNPKP